MEVFEEADIILFMVDKLNVIERIFYCKGSWLTKSINNSNNNNNCDHTTSHNSKSNFLQQEKHKKNGKKTSKTAFPAKHQQQIQQKELRWANRQKVKNKENLFMMAHHYSSTQHKTVVALLFLIVLSSICIVEVRSQCQCHFDRYCYHNTDVASNEVPSCYPGIKNIYAYCRSRGAAHAALTLRWSLKLLLACLT